MNLVTIKTLILSTLSDFGDQVLLVLTSVLGISIAYYLFSFFWSLITGHNGVFTDLFPKTDKYVTWFHRYKGYKWYRSRKWNMNYQMNNGFFNKTHVGGDNSMFGESISS